MIAAGIEDDDVVASTVRGDVRGTRYPHILNHISTYTIPSIDEVLDLYHESSSPGNPASDPEPIYPSGSKSDSLRQFQGSYEENRDCIAASVTNGYKGAYDNEVIGPGAQLYNLRYAYPPNVSDYTSSNSSFQTSASQTLESPVIFRDEYSESTSSVSGDEDAVHLTTIPEEPEPPELEADIDVVKPVFKARRQKEMANAQKWNM